MKHVETTPDE